MFRNIVFSENPADPVDDPVVGPDIGPDDRGQVVALDHDGGPGPKADDGQPFAANGLDVVETLRDVAGENLSL